MSLSSRIFYYPLTLISLSVYSINAFAADETVVVLPKAEFTGASTFETLNQDTFVPAMKTELSGERSTTLDSLKWTNPYPIVNYGYAGGASGVNVGGRSIEDTQVTTMGVPLNLPQGGGADFSNFPGFLWDQVTISQTTSGSGFAPSAASGHVDFTPWTRTQVLDHQSRPSYGRATVSYDHDSQSYSLGAREGNYSVLLGATTGQIEGWSKGTPGLAAEASAIVFENGDGHVLAHVIGSRERAESPGSITFPTPGADLKSWRLIPLVESSFKVSSDLQIQNTAFADLSSLTDEDPSPFNDSDTRTEQFGIENVLVSGLNTLAFSARYVRFLGASYGELHEWPLYFAYTRDIFLSDSTSLKATLNGTDVSSAGFYPGGRASFKFAANEKTYPFAEVNAVAKMPTLVDRYANYGGFFVGNPNLKPERVYAALGGYRFEDNHFVVTSTLKGEYRTGIQVATPDETSVMNGGNAYLLSLNEEASTPVEPWLDLRGSALFTYSQLNDSGFSYPDLPYATATAGIRGHYQELISVETNTRLVGVSAGPGGRDHPAYALFDLEVTYRPCKNARIDLGLDNLLNSNAQAVLDYPLEGRRFFASLNTTF